MEQVKTIINKFKTDPAFKQKIIKSSAIALCAIAFVVFMSTKDDVKEDDKKVVKQNSEVIDDYMLADTAAIIDDKNAIYQISEGPVRNGSEVVIKTDDIPIENDDKVNEYMNNRKKNMDKMNSSSQASHQSYRRKYNPNPPVTSTRSRTTYQEEYKTDIQPTTIVKEENKNQVVEAPRERTLEDIIREKNGKKTTASSDNIRVAIQGDQTISASNSTVRLRLLEPVTINGNLIKTDQFIYAKASFGNNVINLNVNNINYNNTILNVNLIAYDYKTGNKGLSISQENLMGDIERAAENEGRQQTSQLGKLGNIARDIFSGRNKTVKINLVNETYLFLRKD
jgi:hypothetical protein